MSLQLAAQHLASKGRGPDTTLVHMAPGEVAGLQALAKAHGGSLTVNPDTGLPEAGFLSSILPMIAGAALTATGIGAPMAALLVGGGTGLMTGNLRKGLMAGLGAYGGAGLMGSVAGAGQTAAASELAAQGQTAAAQMGADATAKDILLARSAAPVGPAMQALNTNPFMAGVSAIKDNPSLLFNKDNLKYGLAAAAPMLLGGQSGGDGYTPGKPNYEYAYDPVRGSYMRVPVGTRDSQTYSPAMFPGLRTSTPMPTMAAGGPVQEMSERNQAQMFVANGGQMFAEGGETYDPEYAPKYVYDPITKTYTDITKVRPVTPTTPMPADPGASVANVVGNPAPTPANNAYGSFMQSVSNLAQDMGLNNPSSVPGALGLGAMVPGAMTVGSILANIANNDVTNPLGRAAQTGTDVGFNVGDLAGVGGIASDPSGIAGLSTGFTDSGTIGGNADSGGAPSEGGGAPPGDGAGPSDSSGYARGGLSALVPAYAQGGSNLGDYSDGGRLLRGPGDGVSDDIPAVIADKRPARLADGEFVVPARIVSELGNGSTEAGARKLYAMMDRIQRARTKTVGKNKVAVDSKSEKLLPA